MIDLRLFREAPQRLRNACRLKGVEVDIDRGVALEERRRALIQDEESLQCERNRVSKEIGARKRTGEDTAAAQQAMREVNARIQAIAAERAKIEAELLALAMLIPNHPAPDVPIGASAAENVEVSSWGERRIFDFKPLPHWEICERLGLVDFARGAKVAGSGFLFYRGWGARLERALFNFMLDLHTQEYGYLEWFPPMLVNREAMTGTGQLPKFECEMYCTDKGDDLFLIPTAEVPVTNLHRDEILDGDALPLSYAAYSACFRREAGAAGKETRGMVRLHEFNKVELVKFTRPEESAAEHEKLRGHAEEVLRRLGLHYRTVMLCSGDMSFAAAKCYDLEVWAPGVGRYLEVSSCSNFTDFQARRANIRFRDQDKKVKYVHTLNASGVALPRVFIAIAETYQQRDGSLVIPEVLRPYMGREIISASAASG